VRHLSAFALRIFKREPKLKIIKRNILRRGGFAGLRETRLVMSPSIFRSRREAGTSTGIGRFCYLADASFLPNGETRMHTHSDIDVISVMVKGCIKHEGSMENGQELHVDDIQVQRAGSEGFSHNEINPDDSKNRMIQLWVLPETKEEPASYQMFHAQPGERMRVYGGPPDQNETFAARTVIDIAHVNAGESVSQSGRTLAYMVEGSGKSLQEVIREGDLVECRDFAFKASADSKLILVFEI
jgi:redox-sensitive bicupin YhaK (pirin superfamily)